MRNDFCAFILTHGRPDRVFTLNALDRFGYTGKVFLVIDDEDKKADEYRRMFGDRVVQFCKSDVAKRIDEGDNFNDRRAIIYARNVCWDLARQRGCKYFVQLDDDYHTFDLRYDSQFRYGHMRKLRSLDAVFEAILDFFISSGATSVALSQGGDWIGGYQGCGPFLKRKCMNSFFCSVDRPFKFFGRINEDVNTYTTEGRKGSLFFTIMQAQLTQSTTQSNTGGMTELYLDSGTYLKTFYSVMYCPSCVRVGEIFDPSVAEQSTIHYRIHHRINWDYCTPKILREEWKHGTCPTKSKQSAPGKSAWKR